MSKRINQLHYQADQIEAVLASHKINGRVTGGSVTPQIVRFHLVPAVGTKVNQITRLSEELALALGVATCRVVRHGATIDLEFPRGDRGMVHLFDLVERLRHVPPHTAILGMDGEGTPILLRLSSPEVPHVLVSGTTGSGKTALARSMIASLAHYNSPADLALLLIDPKGRGYAPFARLPHLVSAVAQNAEEAITALQWLVQEMERRDRERITLPRIVTFIDELADLALVGGPAVEMALTRISQRGREAGLHLVCCTQKPSSAIIGSLVKANFPARLVGSVASAEDARVAAGIAKSGAERLVGRGDFLLVVQGNAHRLQAAFVSEGDLGGCLPVGETPRPIAGLAPSAVPIAAAPRRRRSTAPPPVAPAPAPQAQPPIAAARPEATGSTPAPAAPAEPPQGAAQQLSLGIEGVASPAPVPAPKKARPDGWQVLTGGGQKKAS
ncbi:MAG: DNA translocase FtsK [Anaerolineae bacterium]